MEKEKILELSRRDHQNKDLTDMELSLYAGNIAGRVGASVCCLLSVIFHCVTNTLLYSPWIIYFSILGTHYMAKYRTANRNNDLSLSILYYVMCLLALIFFIIRFREVSG